MAGGALGVLPGLQLGIDGPHGGFDGQLQAFGCGRAVQAAVAAQLGGVALQRVIRTGNQFTDADERRLGASGAPA